MFVDIQIRFQDVGLSPRTLGGLVGGIGERIAIIHLIPNPLPASREGKQHYADTLRTVTVGARQHCARHVLTEFRARFNIDAEMNASPDT